MLSAMQSHTSSHASPSDNLTMKAAQLARLAPREWREFMEALAVYNNVHRENLVMSPLQELPVNQGRAQSLSSLHDRLAHAVSNADKINRKT